MGMRSDAIRSLAQAYHLTLAVAAGLCARHCWGIDRFASHGMAWAWPEFLGTSTCGGSGGFDLDPPFRLRSIFVDFFFLSSPAILRIGRTSKWVRALDPSACLSICLPCVLASILCIAVCILQCIVAVCILQRRQVSSRILGQLWRSIWPRTYGKVFVIAWRQAARPLPRQPKAASEAGKHRAAQLRHAMPLSKEQGPHSGTD